MYKNIFKSQNKNISKRNIETFTQRNPILNLSMGGFAGAALKKDGSVVLWGKEGWGGDNNTDVNLTDIEQISMGGYAGAALKKGGSVVLWGREGRGGDNNTNVDLINGITSARTTSAGITSAGTTSAGTTSAGTTSAEKKSPDTNKLLIGVVVISIILIVYYFYKNKSSQSDISLTNTPGNI